MPLTVPAHQIVVLPLLASVERATASALLVGTALPDLAFLLGGYRWNAFSHQALGPVVLAPTLGLLVFVWWEALIRPALAAVLPRDGQAPLARLCVPARLPRTARAWAAITTALVIGSYGHLLLDGFTHDGMWPARALYGGVHLDAAGVSLPVARWLQGAVSLAAGLLVLADAARRARAQPGADPGAGADRAPRTWPLGLARLLGVAVVAMAGAMAAATAVVGVPDGARAWIWLIASPGALGAIAGGSLFAIASRRQASRTSRSFSASSSGV